MNLTEDLISVQGIFISAEKTKGFLSNIKHRGGNEITISSITKDLQQLLASHDYIKNGNINPEFDEKLTNICLFLILNTDLKSPINAPELQHLVDIMPQLSTCLLANLIVGLDLCKQFSSALMRFDLSVIVELLKEFVLYIKKRKPMMHLNNACDILKLIVTKMCESTSDTDSDYRITDIAAEMLLNLTHLQSEQIQNINIESIYVCMGHTLYNLLELLLMCDEKQKRLTRIVEQILQTARTIIMAVTIDVFCVWAEVKHNEEVLQLLVANSAYFVTEKYKKYAAAKDLLTMLGTFAQKPKTLHERIQTSDVQTKIKMINKEDSNQRRWFKALVNTQVLDCDDSIKCVEKWAHLCTLSDVSHLLNMGDRTKNPKAKKLVMKCASTLSHRDLVLAAVRFFHQNGIHCKFNDDCQSQLVLLFNKIKHQNADDEFSKDLLMVLMQNFEQTVGFVFGECLKNSFFSANLTKTWEVFQQLVNIDDVGLLTLKKEIDKNLPNDNNCKNYAQLFNVLIDCNVFTVEKLILSLIVPLVRNSHESDNYHLVKFCLQIVTDLDATVDLRPETETFFNLLFDLMRECRCNFINFDGLKREIVNNLVQILLKYGSTDYSLAVKSDDVFVQFYQNQISGAKNEPALPHFIPIDYENSAEIVCYLIKILPLCVTDEWILIISQLTAACSIDKTTESLCDFMILLCDVVNSQVNETEEKKYMLNCLKYCLRHFGIGFKQCLQPLVTNSEQEVWITRNVCRVLPEIPASLKSDEGLALASILTKSSLKSLRDDKRFACLVASIGESHVCKMLAQKILC